MMNGLCHQALPRTTGKITTTITVGGVQIQITYPFEYYSEETAVKMTYGWKWTYWKQGPLTEDARQAVEFTKYGWRFAHGQDYSPGGGLDCDPDRRKARLGIFNCCWLPWKQRAFN